MCAELLLGKQLLQQLTLSDSDLVLQGHPNRTAAEEELQNPVFLDSTASLGAVEKALSRRRCYPCPSTDLACSPLAVINPPHAIRSGASLYPLDGLDRPQLVYSRLVPCLHPAVCNQDLNTVQPVWESWPAYVNSTGGVEFFMCRRGSDPESLMCSRCLPGFEPDGLLCRRCSNWQGPLVVALFLLLVLAYLSWNLVRWRRISLAVRRTGLTVGNGNNFFSILLFFLQVGVANTSRSVCF
jgi:hypothetical protein